MQFQWHEWIFIASFLLQSNVENMSPQIIRQVTKELIDLQKNPPEGIKVFMNEEDITDIQAAIEGPGIIIGYLIIGV